MTRLNTISPLTSLTLANFSLPSGVQQQPDPPEKIICAVTDNFTPPEIVYADENYDDWQTKTYLSHGEMVELAAGDANHWCTQQSPAFEGLVELKLFNRCDDQGNHDSQKLKGAVNYVLKPENGVDYVNISFSQDSSKDEGQCSLGWIDHLDSQLGIIIASPWAKSLSNAFGYRWHTAAGNRDNYYNDFCVLDNTCVSADRDRFDGVSRSQSELVDKQVDPRLHLIAYDKPDDGSDQLFWGVDRNCDGILQDKEYHSNKAVDKRATKDGQAVEAGDVFSKDDYFAFEGTSFSSPRAMIYTAYEDWKAGKAQRRVD
jgi:hypothetical protein